MKRHIFSEVYSTSGRKPSYGKMAIPVPSIGELTPANVAKLKPRTIRFNYEHLKNHADGSVRQNLCRILQHAHIKYAFDVLAALVINMPGARYNDCTPEQMQKVQDFYKTIKVETVEWEIAHMNAQRSQAIDLQKAAEYAIAEQQVAQAIAALTANH